MIGLPKKGTPKKAKKKPKPPKPPKNPKKSAKRRGGKRASKKPENDSGYLTKLSEAILGPKPQPRPPQSRRRKKKEEQPKKLEGLLLDYSPDQDYSSNKYEEIESYPVEEPFAYVRILYNKETYSRIYHVVEPELTRKEKRAIDTIIEALTRAINVRIDELDEDPARFLRRATREVIRTYQLPVKKQSFDKIMYYVRRDLIGFGPIDVLMKDPNIEDISCDGPRIPIYVYDRRYESLETTILWEDDHSIDSYIIRLAQRCDKHISIAEPLLDATLMDGSRAVMTLGREVSTRGSTFTIRKFKEEPFTPPELVDFNTMSSLICAYFWLSIQHGMSALVCGGTASGKTTTLNALALFIQKEMKIVSIEDTRELNLPHPNWIPGCTRAGFGGEAGASGKAPGEVNMFDLLKAALRERPEYIVVGEIRGEEAYVLFQAMSTGHTSYSTVHADSVPSLVHRLENKPIDIPRVMIPALDFVSIQIQTRIGEKRVRRVKQVIEIIGLDPHTGELLTNEVFRWIPATDEFEFSGKSYVLEKIMVMTNMNKKQIMEELKNRREVVEYLVENDIRKTQDVSAIIAEYYVRPEDVMKMVRGEVGSEAIFPSTPLGPPVAHMGMGGGPGAPAPPPPGPMGPEESGLPSPPGSPELPPPPDIGGPQAAQGETFPCPTCSAIVTADTAVCPACGERFGQGLECPTCGAPVKTGASMCNACGEVFGPEGTGSPIPQSR